MAIPKIAPYPMPAPADLPLNRANWQFDPARALLLIHDAQRYFLSAFDTTAEPITTMVRNIQQLRRHCASHDVPVVFSAQPGGQSKAERGLLQDFWGDGPPADPTLTAIAAELAPNLADTLLTKHRYSAFIGTDLLRRLHDQGRDQLLICGVYAHIGVLSTAVEAFSNGVQPFLVADAVADFSAADHQMALAYAAGRCALVTTTRELLERTVAAPS